MSDAKTKKVKEGKNGNPSTSEKRTSGICCRYCLPLCIVLFGVICYKFNLMTDVVPKGLPLHVLAFNSVKSFLLQCGFIGMSRWISSWVKSVGDTETHFFKKEVMTFTDDLYFHEEFSIEMNVYEPKNGINEETAVFLLFHGSGFCVNHPNVYQYLFLNQLMNKFSNMIIVLPNYRKSPEYSRKSIFQDTEESLKYVSEKYGTDRKLIISGDSAGGSMAIYLSRYLRDGNYELYAKEKVFVSVFYPWMCFLKSQHPYKEGTECPVEYEKILWEKGTINKWDIETFIELSSDEDFDSSEKHNFFKDISDLPNYIVFSASLDVLGNEGKYFGDLMMKENENNENIQLEGEVHGFAITIEKSWGFVLDKVIEKFIELYF